MSKIENQPKNKNNISKKKNKPKFKYNRKPKKKKLKFRPFSGVNFSGYKYSPKYPNFIVNNHRQNIYRYIEGILEPSIAVNTGAIIKQPSLFPIPSSTVAFRNNINISTDNAGDFFLAWNPNFLVNSTVLNNITVYGKDTQGTNVTMHPNCFTNLCSKITANNTLKFYPSYVPAVDLSKYRLVSAKLKITYIGSNLNKSGMMYGCATYDPAPILLGIVSPGGQSLDAKDTSNATIDYSAPTTGAFYNQPGYPTAVTYAAMTEQNISNGIWNKSCNVVQTNQGISCLHVPSDPTSQIFYPLGTYFGNGRVATTNSLGSLVLDNVVIPFQYMSETGSQLSYLICGHGLPANTECINIQVYYNFEIIPTTLSAPFMRVDSAPLDSNTYNVVNEVVTKVVPNVSIRTGQSKELSSGFMKSVGNVFNTMKAVGTLITILSKFI